MITLALDYTQFFALYMPQQHTQVTCLANYVLTDRRSTFYEFSISSTQYFITQYFINDLLNNTDMQQNMLATGNTLISQMF